MTSCGVCQWNPEARAAESWRAFLENRQEETKGEARGDCLCLGGGTPQIPFSGLFAPVLKALSADTCVWAKRRSGLACHFPRNCHPTRNPQTILNFWGRGGGFQHEILPCFCLFSLLLRLNPLDPLPAPAGGMSAGSQGHTGTKFAGAQGRDLLGPGIPIRAPDSNRAVSKPLSQRAVVSNGRSTQGAGNSQNCWVIHPSSREEEAA